MGAFDFKADDGITTYYIEFAGDVISVSGDELSGRDLCPNTHKLYQITVESGAVATKSPKQALHVPIMLQHENAADTTECPVTTN